MLTGKTSSVERSKIVKSLNSKDIVIMTKAGSASLNLQGVNNLVFYNISYSVGTIIQCVGRICRVDTKYSSQGIYYLMARDTIDEYKVALLKEHKALISSVFEGEEESLPDLHSADAEYIRKMKNYLKQKYLWKSGLNNIRK